mmetsp:Transcript_46624/g.77092  ORF Transcript_46624/g.77092 Transcript_46624/m.77092 type:complete len:296 (-) Transcript_46624:106-993(-)|eukprot:CAMPEP_0119328784 /NCGR_PEP_ID=MMETSP1333-20130426/74223_1 /TAXON_ID=418940 /ORGANISM="Scyphosphaera apsteinii, Strain RCC1455" /LENGTH=295 /DNA_ID=CAMNT_0007337743 /DNA_START=167 /DNA_END=1054 /DNA_ORIENTATION=+
MYTIGLLFLLLAAARANCPRSCHTECKPPECGPRCCAYVKSITVAYQDPALNHSLQMYAGGKANSWEAAYHHMLMLRSMQPPRAHSSINLFPLQCFSYYWAVRQLTTSRLRDGLSPPVVCEVGFGSGMSTALMLTASLTLPVSSPGVDYHVFDCNNCAGGNTGKDAFLGYLRQAFWPKRITLHQGLSHETLRAATAQRLECDVMSVDGSHDYADVVTDLRDAHALSHNDTILLLDDTNTEGVKRAVREAEAAGLITIVERLAAAKRVDPVMASWRGFSSDKTITKNFEVGRFAHQ